MTEWVAPALVAAASLAVGVLLLARAGGRDTLPNAAIASREDLVKRRDTLYQALRDLPGERSRLSPDAFAEEQERLEREAAMVLRTLERLAEPAPAPTGAAAPSFSERHPQLSGALLGGGIVAAVAAIFSGLPALTDAPAAATNAASSMAPSMAGGGQDPVAAQVATLEKTVETSPGNLEARNRLGHLYILQDQIMKAWAQAEEVTKVAPQDPEARTHQAVVLIASGHADVAAGVLDKVLAVEPDFVEALGYRGAVYREQGQPEKAVEMWQRLLTIDPAQATVVLPAITALQQQIASGTASGAAEGAATSAAPDASAASTSGRVSGTVAIDPALAAKIAPGQVLFVLARPEGQERGPPMAVERLEPTAFPVSFDLGPEDSPMGGTLSGRVTLSARLDQDGNAMTRGEGDLEGKATVETGATGVVITLGGG